MRADGFCHYHYHCGHGVTNIPANTPVFVTAGPNVISSDTHQDGGLPPKFVPVQAGRESIFRGSIMREGLEPYANLKVCGGFVAFRYHSLL